MIINIVLIIAVLLITIFVIYSNVKKKQAEEPEEEIQVDDKTFTIQKMTEYVKKRLDEIKKNN